MDRRARSTAIATALAVLLATCAAPLWARADEPAPQAFRDGLAAAKRNEETVHGRMYVENLVRKQTSPIAAAMAVCLKDTGVPRGQVGDFAVVAKLGKSGKVLESFAHPRSPVAACFRARIAELLFDSPPELEYWIALEMRQGPG